MFPFHFSLCKVIWLSFPSLLVLLVPFPSSPFLPILSFQTMYHSPLSHHSPLANCPSFSEYSTCHLHNWRINFGGREGVESTHLSMPLATPFRSFWIERETHSNVYGLQVDYTRIYPWEIVWSSGFQRTECSSSTLKIIRNPQIDPNTRIQFPLALDPLLVWKITHGEPIVGSQVPGHISHLRGRNWIPEYGNPHNVCCVMVLGTGDPETAYALMQRGNSSKKHHFGVGFLLEKNKLLRTMGFVRIVLSLFQTLRSLFSFFDLEVLRIFIIKNSPACYKILGS